MALFPEERRVAAIQCPRISISELKLQLQVFTPSSAGTCPLAYYFSSEGFILPLAEIHRGQLLRTLKFDIVGRALAKHIQVLLMVVPDGQI
jgi:hypothetical protein